MNTIHPIKAFSDNYIWCLHNDKHALVVDPGDSKVVINYLEKKNLHLSAVLITHHHFDHVNGLLDLEQQYAPTVYKPKEVRVPETSCSQSVKEADVVDIPDLQVSFKVLELPGHTKSHIAFYNKDTLFCGDTLFSLGCGRLFEGTAEQLYHSLNKLKELDHSTRVYCTHEYTHSNLMFHKSIHPNDPQLETLSEIIESQLASRGITLPSTIGFEKQCNLFLRISDPDLQDSIRVHSNQEIDNEIEMFAALRHLKDEF